MKTLSLTLLGLLACVSLQANVYITSFGSNEFADAGSDLAFTQTPTEGHFDGEDWGGPILGTFAPVDLTGATAFLLLTGTAWVEPPASIFMLSLWDGTFDEEEYPRMLSYYGEWNQLVTGVESTITLTPGWTDIGDFDITAVQGAQIDFGGGSSPVNITLTTLTAVPEPAEIALFSGLVGLGCVLVRRRR